MNKVTPELRKTLETAFNGAISYLTRLDDSPVNAVADVNTLRARLGKPLEYKGLAPDRVVAELAEDVLPGLLGTAGGRFFGWVIGGTLPAALGADWLTSVWQQNAALYACSPAASVAEEVVGAWLKQLLHLPIDTSFALVTGCQMAHVTCLAAARHALLSKRGWNVEQQGMFGAPRIRILSSTERHHSFERAVRLLGFGSAQVELLPVDEQGRLLKQALSDELANKPNTPTLVLLQAGDINIGAYDRFAELIPLAKSFDAWVHVDGAFGLWAAASDRYRDLLSGVELADSWATDGHKWLNVPFDCGFAFVADQESHRASLSMQAAYLTNAEDARDEMNWNPEWSRRARCFASYAAIRQLGTEGVAEVVERCCEHARSIVNRIGTLPGTEILWEPTINQGLVRFPDPGENATEEDHDRRTDEVIARIVASGEAFFGGTTWRGRRAMRVSVCNWQTSESDVERAVRAVSSVLTAAR